MTSSGPVWVHVIHREWIDVTVQEHQLTHISIYAIFALIKMYQTNYHALSLSHSLLNAAAEV